MPPTLLLRGVLCGHVGNATGFALEIGAFSLYRGEAVAVVGPSGAGKSTLLDLLALALTPSRAETFTLRARDGVSANIAAMWRAADDNALTRLRAARLGYVLQQGGLLPFLKVRENITLSQDLLRQPDPKWAANLAERLDIAGLLDRLPGTLSVGQRQRVAIARALAHRPELVLADEPTASLHPAMADTVMALLVEQARIGDAALLLATHDPDRAVRHGFEIVTIVPQVAASSETMARSVLDRREPAAMAT